MKNKNILYGIVGFIIGMAVCAFLFSDRGFGDMRGTRAVHRMSNGEMMNNDSSMESMMHDMNMGLVGKTGDEFDKAFLSEMIVHHKGAVDMARAVLATSKRPELIKLANDIISTQTKEIEMMEGWQKAWFK